MKKIILFSTLLRFVPIVNTTDCFKNIIITPISKGDDLIVNYDFEVRIKTEVDFYFYLKIDNEKVFIDAKKKIINNKLSDTVTINETKIKNGSNLIMTANCDRFYKEVSFLLVYKNDIQSNINSSFSEYAIQYLDSRGVVHSDSELLSFEYPQTYQNHQPYLCFDTLKITQETYYSGATLENNFAQLYFKDPENIFPLLHNKNDEVYLNFRLCKEKENTYTFELFDKLYVDKKTYLTSNELKEGFVITDKLYFPKNSKQFLESIYFNINDLGLQKLDLNIQIQYEFVSFIGNSDDSQNYFVITESDKVFEDNKLEVKL